MVVITKRDDRSAMMSLLQHLVKPFRPMLVKSSKTFPAGSPKLSPPSSSKKRCEVHERHVVDTWLYDVVPKNLKGASGGTPARRKRIY